MPSRSFGMMCLFAVLTVTGCKPAIDAQFVTSESITKLDAKLQEPIRAVMLDQTGTPAAPKLLGSKDKPREQLIAGRDLYLKHCQQCHGQSGDGNGPAGKYLYPRPRDYRKGIFKFTSTPYGSKPRRADLARTLEKGIPGTSMPTFRLLPKAERDALVDYVLVLTLRGELEGRLAYEADAEGSIDTDLVPEFVEGVMARWKAAEQEEVHTLSPQPAEFTAEHVAAGKAAFLSKGCSKCHGDDGRGQTKDNIGKDGWGNVTKAADLTSGLLHGGHEPVDVYRRIISGINGTPMPGFRNLLEKEPETLWNLVSYVLYVSNQRRSGVSPAPGTFSKTTPESGNVTVVEPTAAN